MNRKITLLALLTGSSILALGSAHTAENIPELEITIVPSKYGVI
jgi:hypothetical protein